MNKNPKYLISVPATSASIDSDFDWFGIAFNIYNNFVVQELEENTL